MDLYEHVLSNISSRLLGIRSGDRGLRESRKQVLIDWSKDVKREEFSRAELTLGMIALILSQHMESYVGLVTGTSLQNHNNSPQHRASFLSTTPHLQPLFNAHEL